MPAIAVRLFGLDVSGGLIVAGAIALRDHRVVLRQPRLPAQRARHRRGARARAVGHGGLARHRLAGRRRIRLPSGGAGIA